MASVRKRTWQAGGGERTAWVVDYFDQAGKRRLKTFGKKRDADAFLIKSGHEIHQGTHTPDSASVTVAEAAEQWLERVETKGRERSTVRQYRQHVDLHINPLLGTTKLSRLTTPGVDGFMHELLKTRSPAMTRKVLVSLKSLLRDAQRRGLVSQNVAQGVKVDMPTRAKKQIEIPTKAEVRGMLDKVSDRWRPLLVTAIFTGMRASELRGLTWDHIDFDAKVIEVRQRADRWNQIGPPKSDAGRRDIPMVPMVANTLKEWKLACPIGDANLVFPNGAGKVENHTNLWNRFFAPLQAACHISEPGKPKYGLHALRHFYAAWVIEQGFMPKRVQSLLGHSSITMTYDVYGHLFPDPEDDHAKLAMGQAALVGK